MRRGGEGGGKEERTERERETGKISDPYLLNRKVMGFSSVTYPAK